MNVPFVTLDRQYKTIQAEIDTAVKRVLSSGVYLLGAETREFERECSSYIGVGESIGVGSGTDALTLGLCALGLEPGDEIIIPANVYPTVFGVWMAGLRTGARLRLVDCGADAQIFIPDLKKRITKRTKVIVVVHLYGTAADIYGVKNLLNDIHREDIVIVEDCAQAMGAEIRRQRSEVGNQKTEVRGRNDHIKVGNIGILSCFSFYPTKNLGAVGDGGMVTTDDKNIADRVRALRMYGEVDRYKSVEPSGVSRIDEIQAAILRVKLNHLDAFIKKRREIVQTYDDAFFHLPFFSIIPHTHTSAPHLYVIRTKERDRLQAYLTKHGIHTAIHYPVAIHMTESFKHVGYKQGDFPEAVALSQEILSLPLFPEMTEREVEYVIEKLSRFS